MRTPASSVRGVVDETRQIHMDYQSPVEKKDGVVTLSRGEHLNPCLDRLLSLSNFIHQRRFSFIMLSFALDNYFLQIGKQRMLLITSYRLTRKECCICKGTIRVIGLVTLQSLGELAQTSGSYLKDIQ